MRKPKSQLNAPALPPRQLACCSQAHQAASKRSRQVAAERMRSNNRFEMWIATRVQPPKRLRVGSRTCGGHISNARANTEPRDPNSNENLAIADGTSSL